MFAMEEIMIDGRNTRCWKNAPPSMRALFENTLQFGDKTYIVYEGEAMSYSEHYQQVVAVGNKLINDFGIGKGDRVAIAMRTCMQLVGACMVRGNMHMAFREPCVCMCSAAEAGASMVNAMRTCTQLVGACMVRGHAHMGLGEPWVCMRSAPKQAGA